MRRLQAEPEPETVALNLTCTDAAGARFRASAGRFGSARSRSTGDEARDLVRKLGREEDSPRVTTGDPQRPRRVDASRDIERVQLVLALTKSTSVGTRTAGSTSRRSVSIQARFRAYATAGLAPTRVQFANSAVPPRSRRGWERSTRACRRKTPWFPTPRGASCAVPQTPPCRSQKTALPGGRARARASAPDR